MSGLEIMLLVIGAAVFVASFVIPEMNSGNEEADIDVEEKRKEIRAIIDSEMKDAEGRLQDVVDETVNYAVEKSERSLEKVSNEKITAVSEFSETVLGDIHKSYEDTMFLYDMLHDKQKNLHETVMEADKSNAKAIEAKNELEYAAKVAQSALTKSEEAASSQASAPVSAPAPAPAPAPASPAAAEIPASVPASDDSFDVDAFLGEAVKAADKPSGRVIEAAPASAPQVNINEPINDEVPPQSALAALGNMPVVSSVSGNDGGNNNERILELHKMGRSNMAIAKELGLGVGEVNLVIDLFEVM